MNKVDIINSIIHKNKYTSYLEIGLGKGANFKQVRCSQKVGVDPVTLDIPGTELYFMTSDEFFDYFKDSIDFIFIDGLHLKEQVLKDVNNSLELLNEGGTIMMHDCNPEKKEYQTRVKHKKRWCGDVWKAWMELRQRKDIHQICIKEFFGCGILTKGVQKPLKVKSLTYEKLEENREEWLNLISWEEYKKQYL